MGRRSLMGSSWHTNSVRFFLFSWHYVCTNVDITLINGLIFLGICQHSYANTNKPMPTFQQSLQAPPCACSSGSRLIFYVDVPRISVWMSQICVRCGVHRNLGSAKCVPMQVPISDAPSQLKQNANFTNRCYLSNGN